MEMWLLLSGLQSSAARDPGFFSIHQGCGSGYYFASRVYKSNNFWLASNVSLVESESGVPLILLVGELEHDINKFF